MCPDLSSQATYTLSLRAHQPTSNEEGARLYLLVSALPSLQLVLLIKFTARVI